jgi:hypothetical protein
LKKYILTTVACLATIAIAVPAASAQNIGGCQLQGTASFSPGLQRFLREQHHERAVAHDLGRRVHHGRLVHDHRRGDASSAVGFGAAQHDADSDQPAGG